MAIPMSNIQNQLKLSKSERSVPVSSAARRASSSAGSACASACARPDLCAGSGKGLTGECLCVGVGKPPEIVRLGRMIDHRELGVPEGVQTFGAELSAHA